MCKPFFYALENLQGLREIVEVEIYTNETRWQGMIRDDVTSLATLLMHNLKTKIIFR